MIDDACEAKLVAEAKQALKFAYAPYSGYPVGAAVLTAGGLVYSGANIENAAYGESLCAERVAIAKAVSDGHRDFTALAIVAGDGAPASPCGGCRQIINEFSPQCIVILAGDGAISKTKANDLLPKAFSLKRAKAQK